MSELGQFVASVPPVTRFLTLASLVVGGLHALGIAPVSEFTLDYPLPLMELHRLLTAFVVGNPQPMQGLMEVYMVYTFSRGLEEVKFRRSVADYFWYLILVFAFVLISGMCVIMTVPGPVPASLSPALMGALTCTWSVEHHNQEVNFYFLPIKASLLPAVSLGFRLLVDGTPTFILALVGVGAAYVYNCLETRSWGPLYSFIVGKEPERPARVGGNGWFYASGKLEAPVWLKRLFKEKNVPPAATTSFTSAGLKSTFKGEGRRLGSSVKKD